MDFLRIAVTCEGEKSFCVNFHGVWVVLNLYITLSLHCGSFMCVATEAGHSLNINSLI